MSVNTITNPYVRGWGATPSGRPSATDFYIQDNGGGNGGGAIRQIDSGTSDSALPNDGFIQWLSGTSGAKSEYIGPGTFNGQELGIVDGEGTAAQYPITLIGSATPSYLLTESGSILSTESGLGFTLEPATGVVTIGGNASLTLSDNFFTIVLKWDGVSNWVIVSYYNGSMTTGPLNYLTSDDGQILTDDSGVPLTAS